MEEKKEEGFFTSFKDIENNKKTDINEEMELLFVKQAMTQHQEIDKNFKPLNASSYLIDKELDCLVVSYSNGDVWRYRNVNLGAEKMDYGKIDIFQLELMGKCRASTNVVNSYINIIDSYRKVIDTERERVIKAEKEIEKLKKELNKVKPSIFGKNKTVE